MPRILLAGCGRWGSNILRDLIALGCDTTVADPDPGARERALARGARRAADNVDSLAECDGVVVATPTSTHASVVRNALSRGVPVFVEKPMTSSLEDALELAGTAEGRLFVMDKWRYHPGIEELHKIRKTEELGRPRGMHLRHIGWGQPHSDVDVVWILAPHCLTIALEVLGNVPAVKHAFAESLDGNAVTLTAVLADEMWVTVEVSSRSPIKRREFRLHSDDGVAWLDEGWSDHIKIARGSGTFGGDANEIEKRAVPSEFPLFRELRAFVEHLAGGPAPRSSAREGALIVERVHEMRQLAGLAE
jgi:predicted dehydrogenase